MGFTIQNPHLGFFGRRLALCRLVLKKIGSGGRLLPFCFRQNAIELDSRLDAMRTQLRRGLIARRSKSTHHRQHKRAGSCREWGDHRIFALTLKWIGPKRLGK
jgi:hypothetical protein